MKQRPYPFRIMHEALATVVWSAKPAVFIIPILFIGFWLHSSSAKVAVYISAYPTLVLLMVLAPELLAEKTSKPIRFISAAVTFVSAALSSIAGCVSLYYWLFSFMPNFESENRGVLWYASILFLYLIFMSFLYSYNLVYHALYYCKYPPNKSKQRTGSKLPPVV